MTEPNPAGLHQADLTEKGRDPCSIAMPGVRPTITAEATS
jgi:hypothetical protein